MIKADAKPKVSKKSKLYHNTLLCRIFTQIFNVMDYDNDGEISSESVQIKGIHPEILNIIKPILISMEEEDRVIDKDDWLFLAYDLY